MSEQDCRHLAAWTWSEFLLADHILPPPASMGQPNSMTTPPLTTHTIGSTIHPSEPTRPPANNQQLLDAFMANWDSEELLNGEPEDILERIDAFHDPRQVESEAIRSSPRSKMVLLASSTRGVTIRNMNSSAWAHPAALALPKSAKRKNATQLAAPEKKKRMQRKVEISLLRDESEKLQQKLLQLREHWKQKIPSFAQKEGGQHRNRHGSSALTCTEPLWKQIAIHQRDEATQSEQENQALKAQFHMQRKMLQNVRKLLKKRAASIVDLQRQFRLVSPPNPQLARPGCASSFHKLLVDSTSMYKELRVVEKLVHSRCNGRQTFRDWSVNTSDSNELYVELVDSFAVPFDALQVGDAIWRMHAAQDKSRQVDEHFDSSEDTIIRQFISSFNNLAGAGNVRIKQTVRRFANGTQCVFVVNSLIERSAQAGECVRQSQLRGMKWIVASSDGEVSGSPATAIQCYSTLRPDVLDPEYRLLWCERTLRDVLIPILDPATSRSRELLEGMLIDEGIRNRKMLEQQPSAVYV